MAQEQSTVNAILSNKRTDITVTDNTVYLLSTAQLSLDQVIFDNSLNSAASYLKLWDANTAGAVTLNTTAPDFVLPAAAGETVDFNFSSLGQHGTLTEKGAYFNLGLVYAVVTSAGTGGTTSPTNDVVVKFLHSEA